MRILVLLFWFPLVHPGLASEQPAPMPAPPQRSHEQPIGDEAPEEEETQEEEICASQGGVRVDFDLGQIRLPEVQCQDGDTPIRLNLPVIRIPQIRF